MPIPIDENCIVHICDDTTHIKYELLHQNAQHTDERKDKIEEFIEEIQTSMCKTQMQSPICNKTKSQIKKHKHMKYKYIPHAIRDYHKYEEKVRQLEQIKTGLGIDISTARRKNDNKALDDINRRLYYLRIDIEEAVYMRTCILNEIRIVPGYDKFANKKCEYFFTNTGCLNGDTCPYRH